MHHTPASAVLGTRRSGPRFFVPGPWSGEDGPVFRPRWLTALFLLFVLTFCLPCSAGVQHYVDALAGADANDGLAAVFDGTHGPKQTLGAALTAAAPGDTLNVTSGSYTGPFALNGITLTGLTLSGPATFTIQPEQLTGVSGVTPSTILLILFL